MKVLMINGSPRANSNTGLAFEEMCKVFDKNGIETEVIQVGAMEISGCKGCGYCFKNGKSLSKNTSIPGFCNPIALSIPP